MRDRLAVPEAAAKLVCQPRMQGLLAALIEQECSMAELVTRCGMSYSLLSHHLQRMALLGLVRVVGHAPRAGRARRLYRATARSYFIPAALCETLPDEHLASELRRAVQRARRPKGMLLCSQGGPRMQLVLDDVRDDASDFWLRLRLSPEAARQLNAEMRALFERWREHGGANGKHYLVHGACARVD